MKLEELKRSRPRANAAYTLAEVLVAVMVLGTMVGSLYAALSAGFALVELSREDLRATQILTEKLEEVRLCTWSQLGGFPLSFQQSFDPSGKSNNAGGVVYHGVISAGLPDPNTIPESVSYRTNLRLITVSLSWTNRNGTNRFARTRQMQTHVARYGMQNYVWGAKP